MSREIKFRAWDTENKVFREIEEIILGRNGLPTAIRSNGVVYQIQNNGQISLIQYTGLKDKNGKEIYEGDILHTDEVKNGDHTIFKRTVEVKWESGKAMNGWSFSVRDAEVMEVIGNIYQNPELLSLDNK